MKKPHFYRCSLFFIVLACGSFTHAHPLLSKPAAYYTSPEAYAIAQRMLRYQHTDGGWSKNNDYVKSYNAADQAMIRSQKTNHWESTLDNGATCTELRFLDQVEQHTPTVEIKTALEKGVRFILQSQYANGGFPQFPKRTQGYWTQITFNDQAMIHALRLLQAVSEQRLLRTCSDASLRATCKTAVERGIACILACQVQHSSRRMLWCAQHDRETLQPVGARTYERASLSGLESVEIVRFLMEQPQPSPEMRAAIASAIAAFRLLELKGLRLTYARDPQTGRRDLLLVPDATAPSLWARFYDLQTLKPFFCSRDGIPKEHLSEISQERRLNYNWIGPYATHLLRQEYPLWQRKHAQQNSDAHSMTNEN